MAISLATTSGDEPMSQINTTPLIDVMLVLLIVFILTLPLMTHAVKLEVQGGEVASATVPVDIAIEYDGTVLWNGQVVGGLSEFERRLRAASSDVASIEVHVRAEPRAAYDTVAKVLAIAQRTGVKRLGIQGND